MANAKKLPSGNWRVQVSKSINGKLVKKSFTAASKKEAEFLAAQWQVEVEDSTSNDITLFQAYTRYIDSKRNVLSVTTIRNYEYLQKNHLQDIMHLKINKITTEQIQSSINQYSANHSPKSVRNCHGLLSAVFGMFRPKLSLNTRLPQKEKKKLYVPSDEDVQHILNLSKGTNCYIPILLGAFGGMRQGEICALTSDDVNGYFINVNKSMACDSNGKWHIKVPKTFSSNRQVEMPPFVINALEGITGKLVVYNPHSLSMAFNKLIKKSGLPHFRFHDLRHYYASSLHSLNVPDKYIMEQGGWSSTHVLQNVYSHAMENKKSEFSNRISSHFETIIKP